MFFRYTAYNPVRLFWENGMYQTYPVRNNSLMKIQQEQTGQGKLQVTVFTEDGTRPVENALVRISYTGGTGQYSGGSADRFLWSDSGTGFKSAAAGIQYAAI